MQGGGILIEIFDVISSLDTAIQDIISSERLFSPISISGLGIYKKRWKKIGKQTNYDKFKDSNFSQITLVSGIGEDKLLWKGGKKVRHISEEEACYHEEWIVWRASLLEKRILKCLFE